MTALFLAEVFRSGPVLLLSAPEVAVVAILLPVLSTGFDALVPAASCIYFGWRDFGGGMIIRAW